MLSAGRIKMRQIDLDSRPTNSGDSGITIPSVAHASEVTPAAAYNGLFWYDSTNHVFQGCANGSAVTVATSTSGTLTLDQAYDNSAAGSYKIDVDGSAIELEVDDGSNNGALYIDMNDSTNNPVCLLIENAGTGNYLSCDSVCTISSAGLMACTGLTDTGVFTQTGASTFVGAVTVGADAAGHDVILYSDTAGDYIKFNDTEKTLLFEDCYAQMMDNTELHFGDGSAINTGDFKMYSDGTHLYITPVADVANQAIYLGNDTTDVDIIWEGDTNNAIVQFDASTDQVEFNGADLRMQDNDVLWFGDGAGAVGDYAISCDGTDLNIVPQNTTASQKVAIGDATGTNDVDLVWYGLTAGDLVRFDSSDDSVLFTDIDLSIAETGAEQALTVSSAATGDDGTKIIGTGALTDNFAAFRVNATGNLAIGGCAVMIEAVTGTPVEDSRLLELKGAGKLARGIYSDVDPVANDAYTFHSGGATAAGISVMRVSADGAPAAATAHILEVDGSNGTWGAVNCVPFSVLNSGTGACAIFENTVTGALGAQIILQHNPAAEANDDVCGRIQFIGSDSAHADESAGRIDVIMRDETAANPNFDMQFYVDVAGTETLRLEIPYDINGIDVGSTAAASYVNGAGAQSLIIENNRGTNSPIITLQNGAAANLLLATPTTGWVEVVGTDVGALGAHLIMSHHPSDSSEAINDVIARIQFEGQDDANADELYGKIECVARVIAAANPDSDIMFYTDVAGTQTLRLELNSYGVAVGDSGATCYLTSAGARDLVLNANGGTNSGSITVAGTAANGNITLDPNGTGRIAAVGAALANGTAHTNMPQIVCMPYVAGSFDGNNDLILFNANSPKLKVIDVWVDNDTAEGLAATLTVRDTAAGLGNVIATAIDINATTLLHAGSLTTSVLAANSSIIANASVNPGTCVGTVYVMFIEVA